MFVLRCPVNIRKTKSITAISQVNTQDKKNAKNLNSFHVSRGRHTRASIWRKETIKDHYYDEQSFLKRYARQFRRLMNVVTNIYLLMYFKIDHNNNFFISLSHYRFGIGEAFQNLNLLLFVCIDTSVPNFPQE